MGLIALVVCVALPTAGWALLFWLPCKGDQDHG
jgi:hypothetical protein